MNPIPPMKTWLVAAVLVAIASGNAGAADNSRAACMPNEPARPCSHGLCRAQPAAQPAQEDLPSQIDAAAGHALGEVWGRPVPDPRTRHLVAISAFLAQGTLPPLKALASRAFALGVAEDQLRELVYLTLARAGPVGGAGTSDVLRELFSAGAPRHRSA